jgi:hypothetical protein
MAFESRNLRVQLPCGAVTVINCTAGHTITCYYPTVHWTCHTYISCIFGTCTHPSPITCYTGSIPNITITGPTTSPYIGGPIQVGREELGALRESLHAQLKELDAAEEALGEAEKEQG